MLGDEDIAFETNIPITVQILGAGIFKRAIESLLASSDELQVVADDPQVTLILGADGQMQLHNGRLLGRRRRRDHFALLTNANEIDYRLVREAPIEVFVGTDEPLSTLVQGVLAASKGEAFCSPQLVPALIAAAVNSSASSDHDYSGGSAAASPTRAAWEKAARRPLPTQRPVGSVEADGLPLEDEIDAADDELLDAGDDNSLSQEVRTQRLAVALGLSEREAEVAIEAVKGFSNIEIAELLNISLPTIKYHLYRAYQKLGIRRRSQLAAALFVPSSED